MERCVYGQIAGKCDRVVECYFECSKKFNKEKAAEKEAVKKSKISKKEFVNAMRWMWHCTIKQAERFYRESSDEYKQEIVNAYRKQCRACWWFD